MRLLPNISSTKSDHISIKIKVFFYALASFLTLLVVTFYFISTPLGFNLALGFIKPILSQQGIVIHKGNITGSLGDFTLPGLTVYAGSTTVIVDQAKINWSPAMFFIGKLTISQLRVENVTVKVDTSKFDDDDTPTTFDFPFDLHANSIIIKKALVQVDDIYLYYKNLNAAAGLYKNMLSVKNLKGLAFDQTLNFHFPIASLNLNSPFHVTANATYHYNNAPLRTGKTSGKLLGDFGGAFTFDTSGTAILNDKPYQYHVASTIDHRKIYNQIKQLKFDNTVLKGQADFVFGKDIDWSFSFTGKRAFNNAPANNRFTGKIQGSITDASTLNQLTLNTCNLQYGVHDLSCMLQMDFSKKSLSFPLFYIADSHTGDSLSLYGDVIPRLGVTWKGNIRDLQFYNSFLKGAFTSSGIASGNILQPLFNGNIKAQELIYNDKDLGSINISLQHNQNQQYVTTRLQNNIINLKMMLSGHWQGDLDWDGKLSQFRFQQDNRTWAQLSNASVQLSRRNSKINDFCITNQAQFLCLNGEYADAQNYRLNYSTHINPSIFRHILPIKSATSFITSKGNYIRRFGTPESSQIYLDITPGTITFKPKETFASTYFPDAEDIVRINHIQSYLALSNHLLSYNFDSSFNRNDYVRLHGAFVLQQDDALLDSQIQSTVNINWHNVDFLSALIPFPAKTNGHLKADLTFSGKLSAPHTSGKIQLIDSNTDIVPLGVSLQNTNISATITPPFKMAIRGKSTLDNAILNINGEIVYDGAWKTDLNLNGKKLKVANLPELQLSVSPNLTFNNMHGFFLTSGQVRVDQAIVHADSMKSLVTSNNIQNDIIYIDSDQQVLSQPKANPIATDLTLDLGDNTKFYGFGLTSYITGKLHIQNQPLKIALANGKLYFKGGMYTAYGKHFSITNDSNISYNNTPITSPDLFITAHYKIPAALSLSMAAPTMLGVSILGKLQDPKLTLISNPNLSQGDILSYIILGQPINDSTNSNGSDELSKAALFFVVNGGSDVVLQDLKDKLGITDLSVGNINNDYILNSQLQQISNQGTGQNNTAIFVGKALTPSFYVSYGIGVFSGEQEFNARYTLTKNWSVRTDHTSIDTGADLVYTITPN
jgi:hypothetical protein